MMKSNFVKAFVLVCGAMGLMACNPLQSDDDCHINADYEISCGGDAGPGLQTP